MAKISDSIPAAHRDLIKGYIGDLKEDKVPPEQFNYEVSQFLRSLSVQVNSDAILQMAKNPQQVNALVQELEG